MVLSINLGFIVVDLPVLQQAGFMVYFPKLQRNKLNIAGNGFEISLESHYLQHATNPVHMNIIPSKHHKAIVYYTILLLVLVAFACSHPKTIEAETHPLSDDSLLTLVQQRTFQYFWDGAEPTSGAARERYHVDDVYPENDKHIITSGGTGFGIMAILVGIERGFISRKEGSDRLTHLVKWLGKADRFHGVWPHWLNGETGEVKPFSSNDDGADLVETAYLAQGLLCAREYFRAGDTSEQALVAGIDSLWRSIEFDWHRKDNLNVLYWHWSPRVDWTMNFPVEGYNECLILYVLAAASPTHGIPAEVYHEGWARGGGIGNMSLRIRRATRGMDLTVGD
jgi:hypothetical protein